MYIWRIDPLRKQLANEGLTQKEAFRYYIAAALLNSVLFEVVANGPPSELKLVDLLDTLLYFSFVTGGVIWCYRSNGGAEGKEFLTRIVPIAWVMWWRLVSIVIPFWTLLGVVDYIRTGELGRPGAEMAVLIIIMNCLYAGMWWRMGVHMKWVATNATR